jgi:hypothetical protein
MYKLSIYHFCLTCFGPSCSPSSEAVVQFRQWFKSPGYGISARALTPFQNARSLQHTCKKAVLLLPEDIGLYGIIFTLALIFCKSKSEVEGCTGCSLGNLRERDQWGDPDVDGRITLRWIFRKLEGVVWTGWSWLRIGTGDENLCSIKMRGIS